MLAVGQALRLVGFVQASIEPGGFIAFDEVGAAGAAKGVGMDLEEAVLVLTKDEGEGIEHFIDAKPDIASFAQCYARFEGGGVGPTGNAVDAIGGN